MYTDYHTNSINRGLHVVGVPIIIISLVAHVPDYLLDYLQCILVSAYLINYGGLIAVGMYQYFELIRFISKQWKRNYPNKWFKETIISFISGWLILFIGHYIEGNRPALLSAPLEAIYYAPLYTSWGLFYSLDFCINNV
tara:strand:- start:4329 stop:4745 length:417 start_codon:yes stop_codon:yes gene_type:complete